MNTWNKCLYEVTNITNAYELVYSIINQSMQLNNQLRSIKMISHMLKAIIKNDQLVYLKFI